MKRCLALISLLVLLWPASWAADEATYGLLMQVRGREVTGLCLMDVTDDGTIVGTVVNEMGVKAFDFTSVHGKAKVMNVIGPLNKWYVRRVLNRDFSFILNHIKGGRDVTVKRRTMRHLPNGDIVATNERYKISYTFTPQADAHETDQ